MEEKDFVTILDDRLAGLRQQMDDRFDAMQQQTDDRFDAMQQHMDGRFEQAEGQVRQIDSRLGYVETEVRKARIDIEAMRNQVGVVAENVSSVDKKLHSFRAETAQNFADVRSEMRYAFGNHEQRISALERKK